MENAIESFKKSMKADVWLATPDKNYTHIGESFSII